MAAAALDPAAADDEVDPFGLGYRRLRLSLARVELNMYRRTRTSSDVLRKPPSFQYVVRLTWSGNPLSRPRRSPPGSPRSPRQRPGSSSSSRGAPTGKGSSSASTNYGTGASGWWWDHLPESYVIYRSWQQFGKMHNAVANELAFDKLSGCRRVKAPVPKFPATGDLQQFVAGVAATGDAAAMTRQGRYSLAAMNTEHPAHFDLDVMHTIYAENRLGPYLTAINDVLAEVPPEVLQQSATLCRFCTFGIRTTNRPDKGQVRCSFQGPQPLIPSKEAIAAAARHLRQTGGLDKLKKSMSNPEIKRVNLPPLSP